MTFSIIIPTYNRARIIADTVNSVLAQTFTDFEVIVVDDGSTDNTRETVAGIGHPKIRYFHKKNEERSVARNFGAERAAGSYLIFLDSDDTMHSEHLSNLYDYLLEKKFRPRFLFTGFVVNSPEGKRLYQYSKKGLYRSSRLLYGNHLGCSAVVVEKQLFMDHRFDTHPDLVVFEDWELWLRLISREPLHCIPARSIVMVNHPGRSVLNYGSSELIRKARHFRLCAQQNAPMVRHSALALRRLTMGLYSYVALHTAIAKEGRSLAIKYLGKALVQDPLLILKRRFYATIKHLV